MQRAQKVLILRFSSFGDVAIMIPVLRALTKSYPEVEFVVASRPKMSPIFDEFENINFLHKDRLNYPRQLAAIISEADLFFPLCCMCH